MNFINFTYFWHCTDKNGRTSHRNEKAFILNKFFEEFLIITEIYVDLKPIYDQPFTCLEMSRDLLSQCNLETSVKAS